MKTSLKHARKRALKVLNSPGKLALVMLGVLFGCSWAYSLIENHGPIEGPWWGVVTGWTVGYGDQYPETTGGRGIAVILILGMWFLTLFANAHITARAVEDNTPAAFTHEEQMESRRVDDETNFLLHQMWIRQYGQRDLEQTLSYFIDQWDRNHPESKETE